MSIEELNKTCGYSAVFMLLVIHELFFVIVVVSVFYGHLSL
jgi:hypothetical protein